MNDCADSTALRTHLDHPDPALDAHIDTCDVCAGLIRSVAADAGATRQALALLDPDGDGTRSEVDIEDALAAVLTAADPPPTPVTASRRRRSPATGRRLALSGAAALVALVVALTPTGRGAVAAALDAFRGERLQPVTVDVATWSAFVDLDEPGALGRLGEVDTSGLVEPMEVADVAEAEAVAGIGAPALAAEPDHLLALAPGTARVVFSADDGNGVPAELDGAALLVDAPGAIGAVYGSTDGPPRLVVGRSGQLVVRAEGAPLDAIRSFLLDREELPAGLRSQLAAIDDWRSAIPVPVPLDGPGWEEIVVTGRPALAFGDDSGLGAVVLRQDPDGVTVVGGLIGVSRARELAERA
jgi:hypothetical protein